MIYLNFCLVKIEEHAVPPLIVCTNYSLRDWFENEQKCNATDIAALDKRFTQVYADEEAKYGLFFQDETISDIRIGQKLNLKNQIYAELLSGQRAFPAHEELSMLLFCEQELEVEWKKLQNSGDIPAEIPESLKKSGSKGVKPFKKQYDKFNEMVLVACNRGERPITSLEYKQKFMINVYGNDEDDDDDEDENVVDAGVEERRGDTTNMNTN